MQLSNALLFRKKLARKITCLAAVSAVVAAFGAQQATAQISVAADKPNYIDIANDRGGLLEERLLELQLLRQTGQRVRITGNVCYSTCTMFLGLPGTCVSPQTTFGFHGPSSYGRPLSPEVFEAASQIMAAHYPQVLQDWYMKTGRHEIVDVYKIKGADIVHFGIPACEAPTAGS